MGVGIGVAVSIGLSIILDPGEVNWLETNGREKGEESCGVGLGVELGEIEN